VRLCKISILIIKNKTIFNNKILASIAFFIVIYFLSLYLIIYLIYSISIVTLAKKGQKIKKKREEHKLERYNKKNV